MRITFDNLIFSTGDILSPKVASATLSPLSEVEETTWRLILHTLCVRRCVAYVRGEGDSWLIVEAHSMPTPSGQEDEIYPILRYLTASESWELPFLVGRVGEEGGFEEDTSQVTVRLPLVGRICDFLQVSERLTSAPITNHERVTLQLFGHHVLSSLRSILTTSEEDYSPTNVDFPCHLSFSCGDLLQSQFTIR